MTDLDAIVREIVRAELATLPPAPAVEADAGERLLSVASVAERTDVSTSTVRRWLTAGLIPTVRVPGRVAGKEIVCVRQSDLDAWIRGLPVARRDDERHERPVGAELRRRVGAAGRQRAGQPAKSGLLAEIERFRSRKQRGSSRRRSGASGQRTAS